MTKQFALAGALTGIAALAACSGGSTGSPPRTITPTTSTPTATPSTPAPQNQQSTQQVVSVAFPATAIGRENDPVFGAVAGFTQQTYSQVLGFAPGAQIMIRNADSSRPHTLGDLASRGFPATGNALSFTPTGTSTFSSGWQSGNLNVGATVGPITLTAGTYYIGCAYHYASDGMRDVLVVAAGATPGPQATQQPGTSTPAPSTGGGFGY